MSAVASYPLVMRIVATSIMAASKAGEIIRDVLSKGELGIVTKGKDDLQTEADRSAQKCIIASLNHQFPNVKVIGEEGKTDLKVPTDWLITESNADFLRNKCPDAYLEVPEEDLVIWVDPLDGTSEYTQGFLEHVTVLIGVAIKDRAIGGIIHQPFFGTDSANLGRTIWGLKGLGTGGFTNVSLSQDKFVVTTTRSHSNALVQQALDALKPAQVLRVGGAGFKVLQLLEGKAHAYVFASAGCKKWDTCAPEAVLEAHGGRLTDMLGRQYTYDHNVPFPNEAGVLATAVGVDHSAIVAQIPDTVKNELNEKKSKS